MRTKFFLFLFIILCYSINSYGQLVASYSFNGNNANDISGNGYDGIVNGAVSTTDKNGNPNSAYSFNGIYQYIYVPYNAAFNLPPSGQFTISLMIKPSVTGTYAYSKAGGLFIKSPAGSQCYNSMWDYGMYIIDSNQIMIGYSNTHVCKSTTHLQIGQWYCVAGTYNNGDWKVYINGKLEASVLNSGKYIRQSGGGISFGRKGDFPCDYFNGSLDDVRLYNKALSDAEIAAMCSLTIPVSNFAPTDTAFCGEAGGCIDFFDYSTGNPTSWKWYFPGAYPNDTSTMQNPTGICYYQPGTYAVSLVTTNVNGSDSVTISPMVKVSGHPLPPYITTTGEDTLICNSPEKACGYQWYLDALPILNATDSFYVTKEAGIYSVLIRSCLGCASVSSGIAASIYENTDDRMIKVFPNPTKDKLNIAGRSIIGKAEINIINVLGEKVYALQFMELNPLTEIDLKGFSPGIYFVRVQTNEHSLCQKFVVQ